MGVIASDFTTRSQEPLNQKIHTLTSGLHVSEFFLISNKIINTSLNVL